MEYHLADLFEYAVDNFGERDFVICDGKRRTYTQMEERANRLAHHLQAAGVKPGDHVGIYSLNSVEWIEIMWAVFKIRAVWININFRYVEEELRYLFTNADLVALVHQRQYSPPRRRGAPAPAGLEAHRHDRRRQRRRCAHRRDRLRGRGRQRLTRA